MGECDVRMYNFPHFSSSIYETSHLMERSLSHLTICKNWKHKETSIPLRLCGLKQSIFISVEWLGRIPVEPLKIRYEGFSQFIYGTLTTSVEGNI